MSARMLRVLAGCFVLLLGCGRTAPVRPGHLPPVLTCALSVEPRALDFDTTPPGGRVLRELVLRNEGNGPCTIAALTLGATNDATFALQNPPALPLELLPAGTASVIVAFNAGPAALPAVRKGTLEVVSDDAVEPRVTVTLTARISFCALVPTPSPLDFGNVALNTSVNGHVSLVNQGTLACDVSGLALEAGTDPNFTLLPQPTSFTVAPGASATVALSFSGRDSAPPHLREGHLVFRANDAVTPQGRVLLSAYINTLCTEAGQFIYTVDNDGRFSRFDPRTLSYLDIAPLSCPTSASPFSMNVDQNAIAWVIFSDGHLFRVDTANGACSATAYQPNQGGFFTYGMGSAFDSSTGTDTLYLAGLPSVPGATTSPLGSLAFPSLTVTPLGIMQQTSVELAGTGDGQLWAFSPASTGPAVLSRIDRTSGANLERYELPTVTSVGGWAIKFFGGAFYIFIGSDIWKVERSSLDPMRTNPVTAPARVLVSAGRDIVGAGVSTCAPVQ